MSYDIVYDKQFIKVQDKFIPFVLCGSSNVYETTYSGKERRSRNWWAWQMKGKFLLTEEELLNYCEEALQNRVEIYKDEYSEKDIKRSFGFFESLAIGSKHTGRTTFGNFKGLFKTGCEKAITVEQLQDYGTLHFTTSIYDIGKLEEKGLEKLSQVVKTTEEFLEYYNKFSYIYGDLLHVALFLEEFKPKDIRKRYFSSNNIISNKVQVRLVGYWTIVAKNDKYFVRKTKYGYKYSYLPYFKYATKEEARKKANSVDCKYEFIRTEINLVVTTKILDKIEKSLILK